METLYIQSNLWSSMVYMFVTSTNGWPFIVRLVGTLITLPFLLRPGNLTDLLVGKGRMVGHVVGQVGLIYLLPWYIMYCFWMSLSCPQPPTL